MRSYIYSSIRPLIVTLILYTNIASVSAQYMTKQISSIDGLSNSSVNCILEDSEHTLWIGTWDGLNAYNGREIKTHRYNKDNKHSISNNIVRQLIEQDSICLWVAVDGALNRWDKKTQQFDRYFEKQGGFSLAVTPNKKLICYTRGIGLHYFDDKQRLFIKINKELDHIIQKLVIDSFDNAYILTRANEIKKYCVVYKDSEISLIENGSIECGVNLIDMDLSQNRLILNYSNYIEILDTKSLTPIVAELPPNKTAAKISFKDGLMLIQYDEGGCGKYDLLSRKVTDIDNITSETSIFSIYVGSQNIFWIGTDGQGVIAVYQYTSPFRTAKTHHQVRSICEYNKENILIGTKGEGLKLLNKRTGDISDFFTTDNGLASNSVYALQKDKQGSIFIGTDGTGLNIILPNNSLSSLSISKYDPQFSSAYCLLFTHNDSTLWVGTAGSGLIRIDLHNEHGKYIAGSVKQYLRTNEIPSLNNNTIYSIVKAEHENKIWIGTRGNGISKFDIETEQFENPLNIEPDISLTNDDVISITKGTSNSLWIGTCYGVNKLSIFDNTYQTEGYTTENGLINNTVHGILKDKNQNVWISTSSGISFLNTKSGAVTNYTSRNGLLNDEFSDGAYFIDKNNTLYFGGVGGLTYFNADEIHLRNYSPTIKLSNLRVNNINQNILKRLKGNTLKLSYDEPYVTCSFIANDFINNENCEFSYRIINFADEWISNENNPNIILTKLPPGEYKLEVKCTNGDGIWGDNIYMLNVDVSYPWWRSTIAYLIYLVLFFCIAYIITAVIRNRIRLNRQILLEHIEKQHQQKTHESKLSFFTNVAHEFFTPLTLIYGPAQHLLERDNLDSYSKRYIKIIKNNADRMQKLINELMEFRKAETGHTTVYAEKIDIVTLLNYITDNYREIADENKIEFDLQTENISSFVTDRNSFEKILFNLISNAFKYTPVNGRITALLWQEPNQKELLHFRIRNSGRGLSEKKMADIFDNFKIYETSRLQNSTSTGIGLSLTKSLIELLGGTISVKSILGEYVEFTATIKSMKLENKKNVSIEIPMILNHEDLVSERRDLSILIVEDEKNIRELIRDILLPYYNIREACDGKQGLLEVEQNMPDIIISDILMPNLDGIGFIDHVKSNERTMHIPIISISAKTDIEDHIQAYRHGVDLYITKPFHPHHVLAVVENVITKYSMLKKYYNSSRSAVTVKDGVILHQEEEQLLQEIIAYIEKNIDDESLNPSSISDYTGISKASFYEKLKKLTDKTPSEYIRSIRLEHASRLLKTTQLTVSEIMFKSGFSTKSYFYREFGKQYGLSPKEYRKENN